MFEKTLSLKIFIFKKHSYNFFFFNIQFYKNNKKLSFQIIFITKVIDSKKLN